MSANNHADDGWKAQTAADEADIQRLLSQGQENEGGLAFELSFDEPFDQTGKADDALNYSDVSDDDLPDEEEPTGGTSLEVPALTDDGGTSNDTDDLFGEGRESSPLDHGLHPSSPATRVHDPDGLDVSQPAGEGISSFRDLNFDPEPHFDDAANQDPDIPAPAETVEDLIKQTWPGWQKGVILKWNELLPPKKATWIEKKPARKPKPLITTKLSLDLAQDQEKLFRIPGPATSTRKQKYNESESKGLVFCELLDSDEDADADNFNSDDESDSEPVGGFTLQDIEMACDNWSAVIDAASQVAESSKAVAKPDKRPLDDIDSDFWDPEAESEQRPLKKKKQDRPIPRGLPEIPRFEAPSFDSFEEVTKRSAKRVRLDLDDPYLLIDDLDAERSVKRPRLEQKLMRMANGNLGLDVGQRFNMSNDDAYEALKENHQRGVRATLGNLSVEHSLPALKLAWPYYRVKFHGKADQFHRPTFRVKKFIGFNVKFEKPDRFKKRDKKGKAQEVFRKTSDLGLADNSTAILFEYCERIPSVISNFGMGNRVINYYRKKDSSEEDPKLQKDVGETQVLLPEDRSPFSIFGNISPGETVPTLHNQMYRAPIFKHESRSTDFIVSRSTTGMGGSKWYLHNLDHIFVVGQTFPSTEVPGPHSRKVTNASKNRIKMISYRMMRRHEQQLVNLSEVTKHIADSTDAQNRQKLKEFLVYGKAEKGLWGLRPGETLMDEAAIRNMVKPEETCLIEGMQLGMKLLEDAGFDPRNAILEDENRTTTTTAAAAEPEPDDDDEDDDDGERTQRAGGKRPGEKVEETLADKMAPWKTSKAFIDACAGKAMLQLHGEGDPTGHGLGFSFIRTSMKGGYIEAVQGPLATSADAMEREKRANGGHAYNVKKQEAMYKEGIREIWDKQKSTLSDPTLHDDKDVLHTADEDDRFNNPAAPTPAHIDDGTSQISGFTSASRKNQKQIRITRKVRLPNGEVEDRIEIVDDFVVISQYLKRRTEVEAETREYGIPSFSRFPEPHPLAGLELRLPAYTHVVSIRVGLLVMPTLTVMKLLGTGAPPKEPRREEVEEEEEEDLTNADPESRRSSSDSRRTKPGDTPASCRKNFIRVPVQVTPARLSQMGRTKRRPERRESVPTADRLDTSRQTKSTVPAVPPRFTASELRRLFRSGDAFKLESAMLRPPEERREIQQVKDRRKRRREKDLRRLQREKRRLERLREKRQTRNLEAPRRRDDKHEHESKDKHQRSSMTKPKHRLG
jgi:transcription initiation factor TFIID subunit 1, fungi type